MYFQHNLLEAGAHWADFPWRPANCLQATGFPEPPPYVNKKRIFLADVFYDVSHPERRRLHRAYIRKCLDNFSANTNVIHLTGAEYTGPLEFVQFWLDTIREWQEETGQRPLVGLSCTKDVQDAILADPVRSRVVSVIELRYWWYASDGSLYAPKANQNLAPRQHYREWKGNKKISSAQIARQVREYRCKNPDRAVICSLDPADGAVVLTAGGSIPNLRAPVDSDLMAVLPRMKPTQRGDAESRQWLLADAGDNFIFHSESASIRQLDLRENESTFELFWINPTTGGVERTGQTIRGGNLIDLPPPKPGSRILWLKRAAP